MKCYPFSHIGWLLAATVLLTLVGLTAEPSPTLDAGRSLLEINRALAG